MDESGSEVKAGTPPPLPELFGKPLVPVAQGERIESLDILRGFALLGILIANMLFFSQPLEEAGMRSALWFSEVDRFADWLAVIFVEGKFYPLFSFLFGLGFSLQMERASARDMDFIPLYRRRLFVLIAIGVAHGIFLWDGDVLFAYAVCGFALLLFRERKTKTIAIWAAVAIVLPAVLVFLGGLLLLALSGNPEFSDLMKDAYAVDEESRAARMQAFVVGGYPDVVVYRLGEFVWTTLYTLLFSTAFLGLFLIGLIAGRIKLLADTRLHQGLLKRVLMVCGSVGLAGNSLGAWAMMSGYTNPDYGLILVGYAVVSIFGPVLTAAYIVGIVLLTCRIGSQIFLSPLAAVGRMALTNYLLQSAIATTVFYGYGFGLGGNVGRLGTIGMSLVIFAAQVLFSVLWLKSFRYGPMEWLWRSLTYGKRQTMRR